MSDPPEERGRFATRRLPVVATSLATDVIGSCTAITLKPCGMRIGVTFDQLDRSAHAACTRTVFFTWGCCAAVPATHMAPSAQPARLRMFAVFSSGYFGPMAVAARSITAATSVE